MRRAIHPGVFLSLLSVAFLAGCITVRGTVLTSEDRAKGDLRHIILFRFNDDATAEDIRAVEIAFRNLPRQIPEIKEFDWGVEMSGRNLNKGFTHGGVMVFDNEADRDAYRDHPAHRAFVDQVQPLVAEIFVFDYWMRE